MGHRTRTEDFTRWCFAFRRRNCRRACDRDERTGSGAVVTGRKNPATDAASTESACDAIHFLTSVTRGLTLNYGIFIRSDCWADRLLIVHELAHVAQYERLGGILPFLRKYLFECLTVGYAAAALELEATAVTVRVSAE